jgi:hypothetical protein
LWALLWRYLVRHWRGELSLRDAAWQSGTLAYLLLLSPAASAVILAARFAPEPVGLLGEPVACLIALPVLAWHLGGLWRTAVRVGIDRPAAALLTRGVVVLALLAFIDLLWVRAVPEAGEAFDIVFRGDPRIGPHAVRLLPGGTELEVSGGLTAGVAAEVEAQLQAAPQIRVIHLNSPGGRISEGIALQAVIRRHGLETYTSTGCASACTLAFLGGRRRWLGPTAVLGFHQPGPYPGETQAEADEGKAVLAAEMQRAGVASGFIARVLATPFETVWTPSDDELLRSGVVTDLSDGAQFRLSGFEDSSVEAVEAR